MKTMKFLSLAALALTFAACSSNDDELTAQQPAEQPNNGEITITATIDTGDGAATRALSVDGDNIASSYEVGEKIAVLFEYESAQVQRDAEVKSLEGTTAKVEFTIPADLTGSQEATLVYPATAVNAAKNGADVATALATQDGSIGNCPEVRTGTGTLNATAKTLTVSSALAAQNAIFKFTLQDLSAAAKDAADFTVSDGSGNVITTVTPGTATGTLYVALPELAAGTYWFSATIGGKPYIAKATSSATTNGKFYSTTVKMATLGDLMADNGKFYAAVGDIPAGKNAIGVIAYLGNDATTEALVNGGGHGLVLCLKNAASNVAWSTNITSQAYTGNDFVTDADGLKRTTGVSGYAATAALATDATTYPAAAAAKNYTGLTAPAGTTGWFLPSAQQWVKMLTGLGALDESSITWTSWFDTDHTAADKWETALAKAGSGNYDSMTPSLYYWSSSENSAEYVVRLCVNATATGGAHGFNWNTRTKNSTTDKYLVRPVLAF